MALLLLFLAAMRACSSGELVSGEVIAEFDQTGCLKLANLASFNANGTVEEKKCHLLNLILYQCQIVGSDHVWYWSALVPPTDITCTSFPLKI